ncbi:hypothetical protein [Mucilaginibacter celer]|uniref:hypothetical protein n=1 Tax=Mucilaginibacter celer TaxID=2305508 RepID=UPI0013CF20A6|nr:hypothetical protein [Mucilaginibacter celer]
MKHFLFFLFMASMLAPHCNLAQIKERLPKVELIAMATTYQPENTIVKASVYKSGAPNLSIS